MASFTSSQVGFHWSARGSAFQRRLERSLWNLTKLYASSGFLYLTYFPWRFHYVIKYKHCQMFDGRLMLYIIRVYNIFFCFQETIVVNAKLYIQLDLHHVGCYGQIASIINHFEDVSIILQSKALGKIFISFVSCHFYV